MKKEKYVLVIGAVVVVLLMVSSATAVPQAHGEQMMKRVKRAEQVQNLLYTRISSLIDFEGFNEYLTSEEFVQFIQSDEIQEVLSSEELNKIYDNEKFQKFVDSETFEQFSKSEEVQTFLNNIDPDGDYTLLDLIVAFIAGLIMWIPAAIIILILSIPFSILMAYDVFWSLIEATSRPIISLLLGLLSFPAFILFMIIMAVFWPFVSVYLYINPPHIP